MYEDLNPSSILRRSQCSIHCITSIHCSFATPQNHCGCSNSCQIPILLIAPHAMALKGLRLKPDLARLPCIGILSMPDSLSSTRCFNLSALSKHLPSREFFLSHPSSCAAWFFWKAHRQTAFCPVNIHRMQILSFVFRSTTNGFEKNIFPGRSFFGPSKSLRCAVIFRLHGLAIAGESLYHAGGATMRTGD